MFENHLFNYILLYCIQETINYKTENNSHFNLFTVSENTIFYSCFGTDKKRFKILKNTYCQLNAQQLVFIT